MIKTAILVLWIGSYNTQSISVTTFDALAECEAARQVIIENEIRRSTLHDVRILPEQITCYEINFEK